MFKLLKTNNLQDSKTKRLSIALFIFIISSALIFYILSDGNYREINADFGLYFDPIDRIKNSNCNFVQCLNEFSTFNKDLNGYNSWIPTPFYSIFFLLPISILNSDFFFMIQGIIITLTIIIILQEILHSTLSNKLGSGLINITIIIGTLNYSFIKDSLTSGTMSVCFLFILLSIKYRSNITLSSILLSFAAMIRSNYIFMIVSFIIALFIFRPSYYKKFILAPLISLVIYFICYKFFYYSYPGSGFNNVFITGIRSMDYVYDYLLPRLNITETQLFHWDLSLFELSKILLHDISLIYGVIILYSYKIMYFMGFMHSDYLFDPRGIWLQRLYNLIYSSVVMTPAFYSTIFLSLMSLLRKHIILSWETLFYIWSLVYIFIHSLYLGDPRYLIGFNFIYVLSLIRFISLTYKTFTMYSKSI